MVQASGGEGGVPCLAKGKQRRGSKGKSMNRRTTSTAKGETSVNTRLIEEAKAQLRHPGEIWKGCSKSICGVGAEGIWLRVVNVKVTNRKGGVGEVGKRNPRGDRHLRSPLGPKVVYV